MLRAHFDTFRSFSLGGMVLFLLAGSLGAQIDRATITGTVIDPSGALVPNAKIVAAANATGLWTETTSNSKGVHLVPGLAVGAYEVTLSHPGFRTVPYKDVVLTVGETRTINVRFQLAATIESIEVQSIPALAQTSPEISGVISTKEIQSVPVNGRNWASLLLLAPGAIDDGGGDQRTIRFAGRARDDNNYTMDGVDATGVQEQAQKSTTRLQVSQDAVEEFRVSSSLYTAEHGAGASGQVAVVTKSGTNEFHGSAFEYFRNSTLDARAFNDFDAFTNQPIIPPFRLNQSGGTVGGPILKDRTFLFVSYEGLRQFQGSTIVGAVPSVPLRNAIIANSPVMGPIVNAFPIGNVTNLPGGGSVCNNPMTDPCTDEYVHQGATTIGEDSFLVRLDHSFTVNTKLYARASRDVSTTAAPLLNLFDLQKVDTNPANYFLALEHLFSPSIFNEVKFGINRAPYHNPQTSVFPFEVDSDNFEALNNSATDNEVGTTFGYIDNLSITHGRHTFKTGIEVRRIRLNQGVTENDAYIYSDNLSLIYNGQVFPVAAGGDGLRHGPGNVQLFGSWAGHALRHTFVLPYLQDEWKVKPNLTLNLGLRWEYDSVISEAHGRMSVFDLGACGGFCPAGSPPYFPSCRNWDPRVGIAWAPTALHDKTLIRTGFGIYHGAGQNDDLNASLESDANQKIQIRSANVPERFSISSLDDPNLAYPVNPSTLPASNLVLGPRALLRHRRDLYVEQWGLSIQQAVAKAFIVSGFVYRQPWHSALHSHEREYMLGSSASRPYDWLGHKMPANPAGIWRGGHKAKRWDQQLQWFELIAARQFTHGRMWQTQYMWSRSINDGSVGGGEVNATENVKCLRCELGPSIYDIRHNFVSTSVYELPIWSRTLLLEPGGFLGEEKTAKRCALAGRCSGTQQYSYQQQQWRVAEERKDWCTSPQVWPTFRFRRSG